MSGRAKKAKQLLFMYNYNLQLLILLKIAYFVVTTQGENFKIKILLWKNSDHRCDFLRIGGKLLL